MYYYISIPRAKNNYMIPAIELHIEFVPFVMHDFNSGTYSAKFLEFPRVIAEGYTEVEAKDNLNVLFAHMLSERKEEIINMIKESYNSQNSQYKNVKEVRILA